MHGDDQRQGGAFQQQKYGGADGDPPGGDAGVAAALWLGAGYHGRDGSAHRGAPLCDTGYQYGLPGAQGGQQP